MKLKKKLLFWFDEKRDVIVVCLIFFVVLVSVVLGMRMQQNYTVQKRLEEEARNPKKVRLPSAEAKKSGQKQTQGAPTTSFFLKPSPDEVLSLIEEMGEADLPAENQKYTGLRVMWPVYFFQLVNQDAGKARVLLDVSEDGFGVMVQTDIDIGTFPQILETERGKKIWVAGEILGVDGTGTGTIQMTAEEVRFQENLMDAVKGKPIDAGEAVSPGKKIPEAAQDIMMEGEAKQ